MAGMDALGRTVPSTRKLRNNFPSLSGACILEGGWGQSPHRSTRRKSSRALPQMNVVLHMLPSCSTTSRNQCTKTDAGMVSLNRTQHVLLRGPPLLRGFDASRGRMKRHCCSSPLPRSTSFLAVKCRADGPMPHGSYSKSHVV